MSFDSWHGASSLSLAPFADLKLCSLLPDGDTFAPDTHNRFLSLSSS